MDKFFLRVASTIIKTKYYYQEEIIFLWSFNRKFTIYDLCPSESIKNYWSLIKPSMASTITSCEPLDCLQSYEFKGGWEKWQFFISRIDPLQSLSFQHLLSNLHFALLISIWVVTDSPLKILNIGSNWSIMQILFIMQISSITFWDMTALCVSFIQIWTSTAHKSVNSQDHRRLTKSGWAILLDICWSIQS